MGGWLTIFVLGAAAGCHLVFGQDASTDAVEPPRDTPIDAPDVGCADGTREAFDLVTEPRIAGCGGGWSVPGATTARVSTCLASGNDSTNPAGIDCSITNLCADGWHVCVDQLDVHTHLVSDARCTWEPTIDVAAAFFASAQPGSFSACTTSGTDDLYGCGSMGGVPVDLACAPLARVSGNECADLTLGGWTCKTGDPTDYQREAVNVTKAGASGGGALCCRDPRGT